MSLARLVLVATPANGQNLASLPTVTDATRSRLISGQEQSEWVRNVQRYTYRGRWNASRAQLTPHAPPLGVSPNRHTDTSTYPVSVQSTLYIHVHCSLMDRLDSQLQADNATHLPYLGKLRHSHYGAPINSTAVYFLRAAAFA